jgi:hypothetical protein
LIASGVAKRCAVVFHRIDFIGKQAKKMQPCSNCSRLFAQRKREDTANDDDVRFQYCCIAFERSK